MSFCSCYLYYISVKVRGERPRCVVKDVLQHPLSPPLPSSLRWTGGCTREEDASRRSETPSTARCSLWSSRFVHHAPLQHSSQTCSSSPRGTLSFVHLQPESASAQLQAQRRRMN